MWDGSRIVEIGLCQRYSREHSLLSRFLEGLEGSVEGAEMGKKEELKVASRARRKCRESQTHKSPTFKNESISGNPTCTCSGVAGWDRREAELAAREKKKR